MAKRALVPACSRCDALLRSAVPYCENCGGPTPWASHDERIAWEVGQWRASRASAPGRPAATILVRTEEGFRPSPATPIRPAAEAAPKPVAAAPDPTPAPMPPARRPAPTAPRPAASVPVSKKAVAVAIALVIGLPLGPRAVDLARGTSVGTASGARSAAPAPAAAAGAPAALMAAGSGFVASSPDSVRYAIVLRNPNRTLVAYDVSVEISFSDAAGKLVGTAFERIASVPAGGDAAIAGGAGVARAAARIDVRLAASGFESGKERPFVVRDVRLIRPDTGQLRVEAAVSGPQPVAGAEVVAVHLDAAGRIVGGDFTYVDVPQSPRSATAVISTAGVPKGVERVQLFVLAPR